MSRVSEPSRTLCGYATASFWITVIWKKVMATEAHRHIRAQRKARTILLSRISSFGLCVFTHRQSLNGIIQGRRKRSNSALQKNKRCRAATPFTFTTARAIPVIMTGRKEPTMSQRAIPFCRATLPPERQPCAGRRSTPKAGAKAGNSALYRRSLNTSPEPVRITEKAKRSSGSITLIPSAFAAASSATGSIKMTGRLP